MRTALLLIGTLLPLSLPGAEPRVSDAVLGEGKVDKVDGFEIVKPATVFRPNTPQIVCVYKVEGAGLGMNTKSIWIAEDVGKAAPPNYKILEKSLTLPFLNSGSFSLSKPNNGFPVGAYRLEIYLGSKLARTLKFSVQAP
jgi:hypothetical protein